MKKIIISLVCSVLLFFAAPLSAAFSVSAGLKGTYNSIPENKRQFSPLIGAIVAENGELAATYQETGPLGDLARALFSELNGEMRCTVKVDDPASALPPRCIWHLITQLQSGKPCADLFPEKDLQVPNKMGFSFKDEWLTGYNAWLTDLQKKETDVLRNFRKNGKKTLASIDAAAACNLSKTQELLLAYGYLKCTTPGQLQDFARLFYPALPQTFFTNVEFDGFTDFFKTTALTQESAQSNVEQMAFWLLKRKVGQLHFLKPRLQYFVENNRRIPLCVEGAIQTVVNCALYDPQTKLLTTDMLPAPVITSLNPQFKAFIKTHNNPLIKDYYTTTLNDWINLLTGIPNIVYKTGNKEIKANAANILTAFNFLFGTNAKNFKQLSELISSDARAIKVVPFDPDDDEDEDDIVSAIWQEEFPQQFAPEEAVAANAPTASSNNSESGDDSSDDSDDDTDNNDNEENNRTNENKKQYIKFSFTSAGFAPVLKLLVREGHSAANFVQTSASYVPTIAELDNLTLVGKLIGHNLLTLFNVDWYKTVFTFYKNKVFTTGPEFLKFLKKYPVTPEEIAAPSRYDADDFILDDCIALGKKDFVEALIEFGIDINRFSEDNFLDSPLATALSRDHAGKAGIAQLLLENGAIFDRESINKTDEGGYRFLDHAVYNQDLYAIQFLLEQGADPNLIDSTGNPHLLNAAYNNNIPLMKLLLQHRANPNLVNNFKDSPLHWTACVLKNIEITELLLRNGANPNQYDSTPVLLWAIWRKNPDMARLLIEYGADPRLKIKSTATSSYEETALSCVAFYLPELTELIKEKAAEFDRKEKEAAQQITHKVKEVTADL